MITDSQYGRLS